MACDTMHVNCFAQLTAEPRGSFLPKATLLEFCIPCAGHLHKSVEADMPGAGRGPRTP